VSAVPANPGRVNLHATALVAGAAGVLVFGPSGAGKTALALAAIAMERARGRFAMLVADDRVWLSVAAGRLVAEVPEPIAGLAEIRGLGPVPVAAERQAVIDRVVRLVPRAQAPRLAGDGAFDEPLPGIRLPRLDLPEHEIEGGARALCAWLERADSTPS